MLVYEPSLILYSLIIVYRMMTNLRINWTTPQGQWYLASQVVVVDLGLGSAGKSPSPWQVPQSAPDHCQLAQIKAHT